MSQHTTITVDSGPAWIAAWQDEYCQCHYRIRQDGEVEVYDDVAGGYTRCHSLTPSQLDAIRAAADLVTVEIMPEHLRASHRAARNWGVWPHNGSRRIDVTEGEAEAIIETDPDGYAHIVD